MSFELFKKAFFTMVLIAIGGAALSYMFIYHVKGRGVSAKDGWMFDIAGYHQAIRESKLTNKPVFLYLRRQACQRCIAFEQDYLNDPELKRILNEYVKVQVNIDTDRDHERFADQFNLNTYPSMFIMFDQEHPISTYLVLEMAQIWVARDTLKNGNFMPLSPTSFRLSVTHATILARKAASMDDSNSETPP
ncbi:MULTISPECIES: thioredoxin family protein [unclassified Agarivorans]|uniref:thioredoxin family protein n=1 Tax=unclassified Agarivorans TaxID=2636026 RepID=UPI0026E30BEF|nr:MULTISPECIES: thioredoxin family protein [unclassified Agarivorans]MDO6685213.1 thioredoxin family protein [Agarivorans sp. 3_MG-2023]MDO6715615.1 thioredoxin family protein [Agarivorans sp. 2_MG-2023]